MKAGRLDKTAVLRNMASTLPAVFALMTARAPGQELNEADLAASRAVGAAEYFDRKALTALTAQGWAFSFGRLPNEAPITVASRGDMRGYCSLTRYPKAQRAEMVEFITGEPMPGVKS